MTATLTSPNGVATGYLPALHPRYRWVSHDDDGEGEPFRAEIRSNLTFGEIDTIDLAGELSYTELWNRMAPYVRAWNLQARDVSTGEVVTVAAPMEAGPEVFAALTHDLTVWLALQLKTAHFGGETEKKESKPPASSPESMNGHDGPEGSKKHPRRGSTSPSGSI